MKLLTLVDVPLTKDVYYFDILLTVVNTITHIATDEDGCMYGYDNHPYQKEKRFDCEYEEICVFLGTVDLDGLLWFNSVVEV
jgi:hypothetical protein